MAVPSALRGLWQMGRVGLHLAGGAAILTLAYPTVDHASRLRLKQRWSRRLISVLGIEFRADGSTGDETAFVVANHSSWVDIFVINALVPAAFVCKEDVRRWPLIGWFSAKTDTIFLRRGSKRAARDAAAKVRSALLGGLTVAAFPEGTTSAAAGVLPFHSALFQAAVDSGCAVRPLAIRYTGTDGRTTTRVAYYGDMSFIGSLRQICCSHGLRADLHVLAPLPATAATRHILAQHSRSAIAARLAAGDAHDPSSAVSAIEQCAFPAASVTT